MDLPVRICVCSTLFQIFLCVSSFSPARIDAPPKLGEKISNFGAKNLRNSGGQLENDNSAEKELLIQMKNENCKPTSKGHTACVRIGSCERDGTEYYEAKYKSKSCLRSNGRLGECCPKIREEKRRRRATEGKAVVNIVEESKVSSGALDLTKIGDTTFCGRSSKVLDDKVPEQSKPEITHYPWLVALIIKKINIHYCGGALIDRKHVLTAAHCVPEGVVPEGILVKLGEYDFNRDNDSKSFEAAVESIKYHEDYDPATYENDIAIIKLKNDVDYNPYVSPVCLPHPEDLRYKENVTVVVAGWGKTDYKGNMSDLLMEVKVPLWDQNACVFSFSQTVFESSLCAAGYDGGFDSCQGDSGGPLVTQREDGRWITLGVVSWGIKCGDKGKPGIYTRVNEYLEWIAQNL